MKIVVYSLAASIISGGIAGVLFATGFGAIVLSIFISVLICGILLLAREISVLREDLNTLAISTKGAFESINNGVPAAFEKQQDQHHNDIQGIYQVISNITGGQ